MPRLLSAVLVCAGLLTSPAFAHADPSAAGGPAKSQVAPAATGVAVVALGDASAAAWPLARELYARASLRPTFDDAHARVLAGEAPGPDAPRDLADLAETRSAIHGDDAPSRRLLASLATTLHVKVIVVVMSSSEARAFVAESGTFDAARYAPDAADGGPVDWAPVAASLDRTYGERTVRAPALATANTPPARAPAPAKEEPSHPFYASPWFWAAVGAAAFGGVALYFATRDNGPDTIHLQLQVPR